MKNMLALLVFGFQSQLCMGQVGLDVTLAHGGELERQTQVQLNRVLNKYDITKWCFTKIVNIETGAIPHSHPILTLNTRHLKNDNLLLATFLHEQLHWFLDSRQQAVQLAVHELQSTFPSMPIGYPQGADSEESNYEHLIVIYLEYKLTKELLGDVAAKQVMTFWAADHYTQLYSTVLDKPAAIQKIISKYGLLL
jgi:hypothetical protein